MAYGKLNKTEQMQLKDLSNRINSINILFDRLVQEQENFEKKKTEWFEKLREKYKVPNNVDIYVNEEFKIIEDTREEEEKI
jgi:hypothetical protein